MRVRDYFNVFVSKRFVLFLRGARVHWHRHRLTCALVCLLHQHFSLSLLRCSPLLRSSINRPIASVAFSMHQTRKHIMNYAISMKHQWREERIFILFCFCCRRRRASATAATEKREKKSIVLWKKCVRIVRGSCERDAGEWIVEHSSAWKCHLICSCCFSCNEKKT